MLTVKRMNLYKKYSPDEELKDIKIKFGLDKLGSGFDKKTGSIGNMSMALNSTVSNLGFGTKLDR